MKLINELTNEAKQSLTFKLDDGSTVLFFIQYVDNQQGWFYSAAHDVSGFSVKNRRLVMSPNTLRAFREIIPFGFACTVADGEEPIFQSDFVSGRVRFYLLNAADIISVEGIIHA